MNEQEPNHFRARTSRAKSSPTLEALTPAQYAAAGLKPPEPEAPETISDDEIKRRQDEQALLVSRAFSVPAIDFDLAVDRVVAMPGAPAVGSVESAEATDARP